jgi:nucleotide-binding universal stress UspA family protein
MTERQDLPAAGACVESTGSDQRRRVVVGVDGSTGSRAALVYAWTAAATRDAELEVVGTYAVSASWIDPYAYDPTLPDTLRAHTEETVSRLVEEVRRDPAVSAVPGAAIVPVRTVVSPGPAAQELVNRSRDADLLVVGSRGRGGMRSAMLGSVALHCATHAECPVVVAHPMTSAPNVPARVVVGIDGSDRSRAALIEAAAEAARRGGHVEAVAAYELADYWTGTTSTVLPSVEQIRAAVEARAQAFVRDVLHMHVGEGGPPGVHVEIIEGPAHDVLVSRAHGAGLLVVGSTGHGELSSLLFGSVALHCAMHAPCPVMVVHPRLDRPVERAERAEPAAAR